MLLITKSELARLLNTSTRTIDRWRSAGVDLAEVLTPGGVPRFNRAKVEAMIEAGRVGRRSRTTPAAWRKAV